MQAPATIRLIFTRAIRSLPDSRSVSVRMVDLVAAFGQETAERLAGKPLDVAGAQERAEAARKAQLDQLRANQAELQQLANAGIADSRRELAEINKLITRLEAGQLQVPVLVQVPVAQLRPALDVAADATAPVVPSQDA